MAASPEEKVSVEAQLAAVQLETAGLEQTLRGIDEEAAQAAKLECALAYAQRLRSRLAAFGVRSTRNEEADALASRTSALIAWEPRRGDVERYLRDVRSIVELVRSMREVTTLPLRVRYDHVNVQAWVEASRPRIRTVLNSNPLASLLRRRQRVQEAVVIKDATGVCDSGTMTLVLGPPSSGKSSLLKVLTARLETGTRLSGSVTYNGCDVYARNKPFAAAKIAAYVDQRDEHSASLTVQETLEFAWRVQRTIEPTESTKVAAADRALLELERARPRLVMRVFGIEHVRNTIVGDGALRGISGGQRKRVTVAEQLMGHARFVACDEPTTGLDAQTALEIVVAMRAAARVFQLTFVGALLQPPPEVFAAFDRLVLLDAGRIIYDGPVTNAVPYFATLGFRIPPRKDAADFLVEVQTSFGLEYYQQEAHQAPPLSADDFAAAFERRRPSYQAAQPTADSSEDQAEVTVFPDYFRLEFPRSRLYYAYIVAGRRIREIHGNCRVPVAKFATACIVGVATGTLFYDLDYDDYLTKYGLTFSTAMYLGLGGFSAIPRLIEHRATFYKHRDAAFYPTSSFVVANSLVDLPLLAAEATAFTNLVYWSSGLSSSAYPGFLFGCFLVQLTMTLFYGVVASIAPDSQSAQPAAGVFIVLFIIFSGYIIARDDIPEAWKPVYWASPIAWGLRALLVNEFRSPRYKKATFSVVNVLPGCSQHMSDGVCFLEQFDFQHQRHWFMPDGLAVLAAMSFCFLCAQIFFLEYCRPPKYYQPASTSGDGTNDFSKILEGDEYFAQAACHSDDVGDSPLQPIATTHVEDRGSVAHKQRVSRRQSTRDAESRRDVARVAASMPFEEMTLAFHDVHYYVDIPSTTRRWMDDGERLELLDGVSAFARPGDMTALMGSSGAGKTTLLDVLAGRKTGGLITGTITLNGRPKRQALWVRVSGYCEQMDVHSPGQTVQEAVNFSASLRLPSSCSAQERTAYCGTILALLELEPLAGNIVGTASNGGLTFEQRKRLSISVELAANPSIIFLDEPTSGLDSRAALVVMRAIKNVALTRRTIVCTIHQPSYALFSQFDRLLLLKKGGKTVYFGELGRDCETLVTYFQGAAAQLGVMLEPLGHGDNPATWMLNPATDPERDFAAAYSHSSLAANNELHVRAAINSKPNESSDLETPLLFLADSQAERASWLEDSYATTSTQQFLILARKLTATYWRSPTYNVSRKHKFTKPPGRPLQQITAGAVVSVIVALTFGSCFMYSVEDVNDAIGRCGLFFVSTYFMGLIYMNTTMPVMSMERAAFYREKSSSMYRTVPFALAFVIVEVPYIIVFSFLFVSCMYCLVDMYPGYSKFFFYVGFYMSFCAVMCFFGQLLVVALPDMSTAQAVGPPITSLFSLFSGFVISPDKIPKAWKFLYFVSPVHYMLEGMTVTQFHGVDKKVIIGLKYNEAGNPSPRLLSLQRYMSGHTTDSKWGGEFVHSHRYIDLSVLLGRFLKMSTSLNSVTLDNMRATGVPSAHDSVSCLRSLRDSLRPPNLIEGPNRARTMSDTRMYIRECRSASEAAQKLFQHERNDRQ